MDIHYKKIVKLSAGFLVIVITYGVIHFYTHPYVKQPLEVYHKTRFEDIGMSLTIIENAIDQKVTLPQTVNVGQVSLDGQRPEQLNKQHLYYCTLRPGDTVEYSFNSSDPIWFTVAICDEPTWNLNTEEIFVDESNIITYAATYRADHTTVICFRFKTEPPMTSKFTFKGIIRKYAFS